MKKTWAVWVAEKLLNDMDSHGWDVKRFEAEFSKYLGASPPKKESLGNGKMRLTFADGTIKVINEKQERKKWN